MNYSIEEKKEIFIENFNKVQNTLYRIARARLLSEEDAYDAVQNAAIQGYLKIDKLRDIEHFKPWITKILINECNHIYKAKDMNYKKFEKYSVSEYENPILDDSFSNVESKIDFDKIIADLNFKEQETIRLYYEEGYSIKQIASITNENVNTIKTRLSRGKNKIKGNYKKFLLTILILFVLTTGVVFGKEIVNYLKELFNLNDIGIDNEGILSAIDDKEWVQNVDMDYITIDDNYKLKVSYILMDDINIYMVFELVSEDGFGNYNRFTIGDLVILDENDNVIYDYTLPYNNTYALVYGWKNISQENYEIKELLYLISDDFPVFEKIRLKFSKLELYNTDNGNVDYYYLDIDEQEIIIDIEEKFFNRINVEYEVTNKEEMEEFDFSIEKAMLTDTGFYAIVKTYKYKLDYIIINEYGEEYEYSKLVLDYDDGKYLVLLASNISGENITIKNKNNEIHLCKVK